MFCLLVSEQNIQYPYIQFALYLISAALFSSPSNLILFVSDMSKKSVQQYVITSCTIVLCRLRAAYGVKHVSTGPVYFMLFCIFHKHGSSLIVIELDEYMGSCRYQYCVLAQNLSIRWFRSLPASSLVQCQTL